MAFKFISPFLKILIVFCALRRPGHVLTGLASAFLGPYHPERAPRGVLYWSGAISRAPALELKRAQSMVGTTISHYEILEKLGEGGMGLVFKARDLQLGRFVAIKVLIGGSGESSDHRARFIQEARAASALNHPNIITIHDIVSIDDGECIVMEFVQQAKLWPI